MGVWIETRVIAGGNYYVLVTPYVGVWIETIALSIARVSYTVTPYVGVWIETITDNNQEIKANTSLLMWECGLKQ